MNYLVDIRLGLIHVANDLNLWQPRCGARPSTRQGFAQPFPGQIPPGTFCANCLPTGRPHAPKPAALDNSIPRFKGCHICGEPIQLHPPLPNTHPLLCPTCQTKRQQFIALHKKHEGAA